MKGIYLLIITAFSFITGSFAQTVVVAGADAATLAGNPYTTLKAAFDKINLVSQAGNVIVITITGTTAETGSAALNQSVGPWTSVTIIPTGAASVTGNIAGHLVDLVGADNVTINGLNAGGNSLSIINTNGTNCSTIRFVNDASNNTISNCTLLGSTAASGGAGTGVVYFHSGLSTGNDNNTITLCNIGASVTGTPLNGILSIGTSAVIDNSNNTISNNNIFDFFNAISGSVGIQVNTNSHAWTITDNKLYQTATRIATVGSTYNCIWVTSGSGYTIQNNVIGFAASNGTGTTNMIGLASGSLGGTFPSSFTAGGFPNTFRYNGITCAFTAGGTVSSIQNNTIAGIAIYSGSGASTTSGILCGIQVTSGNANIGTVTGNTIGSASGSNSIYAAAVTAGAIVSGIYCTSTNTITIQNNTIGGIDVSGTTATHATGFKGIEVTGAGIFNVSNNNVGNATANNIRTGYLLTGVSLSNTATTPTAASGTSAVTGIVSNVTGATAAITIGSNIIHGMQVSGTATTFSGISNTGLVTTTIGINSNQIGNSAAGAVTFTAATSGTISGISNSGVTSATINMIGNTVVGISCVSSGDVDGITNSGAADVAINITNNQLGTSTVNLITYSAATANTISVIENSGGNSTCALTIQSNSIRGIVHSVAASGFHQYIYNIATGLFSENINSNIFVNLNVNTTGNVTFIRGGGGLISGRTYSCSNNSIITGFNKSGASGNVYLYLSAANCANGSIVTETGNNFSNITMSGTGTLYGWQNQSGISSSNGPTRTITGNTFTNIIGGSGVIYVMYLDYGGPTTCSSNTITGISGTGSVAAIYYGTNNGQGTHTISSNTISSLTSTGTGGSVSGISGGSASVLILDINNNNISGLSSTGALAAIEGIRVNDGATVNVNDNLVNTLTASGTTSPKIAGIVVNNSPATVNVFKNKVISLQASAAITPTFPAVVGLELLGGLTLNAYNNFIADLKAPATNFSDAILGIWVQNLTPLTTFNVYYNSVYLNAVSSGTNFGTSGIYHTSNATSTTAALNLINNIIVNTSTPNGTGRTTAHRRFNTFLNNYASTSDHNLFYAGTPSASRVIFYDGTNSDQTLAAYQTRVSTRDANSISVMPNFTSSTDLHLTAVNCQLDGRGTPVAGITTDIDAAVRNVTTPDIGADEFTASFNTTLAGVAGSAICETRTVSVTGTTFTSNACDLIAKVLPSGGAAVSGKINTCVTLDATQQYFNAEPYLQRHFDIEPATSNITTTSATITLYFTNAEFVNYNTNTVGWPKLPTAVLGNADPNRANLKITQYHGTPTTTPSTPGNYTGNAGNGFYINPADANIVWNGSYWAVTFDVAGFSGFYLHTNPAYPLPVSFNYLNGVKQGNDHLLTWSVSCNTTPSVTLTLERSADQRNFNSIYSITADAVRCNQPFDYTDAQPLSGINYYRLKIVDIDGKITYSNTIALINGSKGFALMNVAPNPVTGNSFNLNATSAKAGKMEIVISDMQGRIVNRQTVSVAAGFSSTNINVSTLAPGTYNIYGITSDDKSGLIRFVKQ